MSHSAWLPWEATSISKSTSVIRDGAAPEARNELAQTGRSGLIRETSEPRRGGTENQTCRINGEARRVPLNERACRFALNRFEIDYHSISKSTSVIRDGPAPEARNELAQTGRSGLIRETSEPGGAALKIKHAELTARPDARRARRTWQINQERKWISKRFVAKRQKTTLRARPTCAPSPLQQGTSIQVG